MGKRGGDIGSSSSSSSSRGIDNGSVNVNHAASGSLQGRRQQRRGISPTWLPAAATSGRRPRAALRAPSPLLAIPFSLVASGPSGCGKSFWVRNLLLHPYDFVSGGPWQRVFYFSRFPLVDLEADLTARSPLTIEFHQGETLPTVEQLLSRCNALAAVDPSSGATEDQRPQILLVLDDMVEQASASPDIRSIFTEGRHTGFSIILTSQNLFHPGRYAVTIRRNAVFTMLWESVMDRQQVRNFFQRQLPLRWRELLRFYDDATRQPYGYLFIDRRTQLLRYRTNMTGRHQTVYVLDGPALLNARAAVTAAAADAAGSDAATAPVLVVAGGAADPSAASDALASRVRARLNASSATP